MADLHDLTAVELAAAIRDREVSPTDVTEHFLARAESLGPIVGAFIRLTPELARSQARAAERVLAAVEDPQELPPLLGVPVPIKDLDDVAGVPTTYGSAAFDDAVFDEAAPAASDSNVVARIRQAGAVITGKTNTPEFGCPCYTEPDVAPPARTPWDLERSAGGSSGGAAAAVAVGLAPVAQGSDGGGSLRIPASVCGVVGLKPSRGRVSNGPGGGDIAGLACKGPLARTVGDVAFLLDAIAGPMPGDPYWAPPLPDGESFAQAARRDPGRLRIGRHADLRIGDIAVHPDCLEALDQATTALTAAGHEVEEFEPPDWRALAEPFQRVWAVMAGGTPLPPERERRLRPLTRWLREQAARLSAADHVGAVRTLRAAARDLLIATDRFDAVLTPTLARPPVRVGELRNDDDPAADFAAQSAFTPFTAVANVAGQPSISLPLHWNRDGLPIGIMLTGRPAGEAALLALAAQLESAQTAQRPPVW